MTLTLGVILQPIINSIEDNNGYFEIGIEKETLGGLTEIVESHITFLDALTSVAKLSRSHDTRIWLLGYKDNFQCDPDLSLQISSHGFVGVSSNMESIKMQYTDSDVCMSELLASIPADGLTLEEAFELYILARKWADKDRFFVEIEEGQPYLEL